MQEEQARLGGHAGERRRARAIMVQGTMSGAGKSLIAAGLCRVFAQDGLTVAPFKSQNMSLNSAVTPQGLEIGRAQALQARACGIPAEAAMNPILLKPTTDVGSQVVVMGRPQANMSARDYYAYKTSLVPTVQAAFDDLASRFDVVVIEGAGSPVEINLKRNDIVNMGMAKMAHAPVLLVGNIDCGGVFAQFVGTHALLDDDERRMLKACVINKFRGDVSLLQPGLDELERRMGVPVAGVVPFVALDLDEEDGFSARKGRPARGDCAVEVAVVDLPHISNATDFEALACIPEVGLRYAAQPADLAGADLVVIPGSKATLADLAWLRERGFDTTLRARATAGEPVLGICGGYQMLGARIDDPLGVEGGGSQEGLGLLPVRTEFGSEKCLCASSGMCTKLEGPFAGLSGLPVEGYQIHMGASHRLSGTPFAQVSDEGAGQGAYEEGCVAANVCGTYLHGLFDTPDLTRALLEGLAARKGLAGFRAQVEARDEQRDRELDVLADTLRASLDMDLVYRILEEGI